MPFTHDRPLAIYYEHLDWFRPLFAELDRRGVPYVRLHAGEHQYEPTTVPPPYRLVLNRMSPSAYLRGHGSALFYTLQYLSYLERIGTRVINGSDAYQIEVSKAAQLSLLSSLGLPFPRTRVIHDPGQAPAAARELRFPVVVKPNVGGSGAGIRRFESAADLAAAASTGTLELGPDTTALVQECIPAADSRITRVELLGGKFLYAIRVRASGDAFNLCPADLCLSAAGVPIERGVLPADAPNHGPTVERYVPSQEILRAVERLLRAATIDVGGVEYVVDARDGRHYFYDINALSNFVADAPRVLGFDPVERLVDYLEREAA